MALPPTLRNGACSITPMRGGRLAIETDAKVRHRSRSHGRAAGTQEEGCMEAAARILAGLAKGSEGGVDVRRILRRWSRC